MLSLLRSLLTPGSQELTPDAQAELRLDASGLLHAADPGRAPAVGAALEWLCRAQDYSASADGGVARDFSLIKGWATSYPETTGYIIPTIVDLAARTGDHGLHARARRMLDWCVSIQFPEGGFQGGKVDAAPKVPVTFNTGQILLGLCAGARHYGDAAYVGATQRAASWLRDTQDTDGCWRKHPTPFAAPGEKAYETHVSWGLFEAERVSPEQGFGGAGFRQIAWALTKQAPNGWFASNCLTNPKAPLTHTIGYVLRGVIEAYLLSGDSNLLAAARRTADGLIPAILPDGWLSGRLDAEWRGAADYVCLTGSVQIAHCLFLLYQATRDDRYMSHGQKLTAFVRRTVRLDGADGQRGGVKGSFPVGGDYGKWEYLNWAAKFFIDANLLEMDILGERYA